MKRPEIDKQKMRFSFTYIAIALAVLFLIQGLVGSAPPPTVPYSRFQTMLEQGQIEEALIGATSIRFRLRADAPLAEDLQKTLALHQPLAAKWTGAEPERVFEVTRLPNIDDNTLLEQLTQKGVTFAGRIENTFWRDLLLAWILPVGLLMLVWSFAARRLSQGGIGSALTLGKNRARIYSEQDIKVRFDDVAGIEEAKAELQEIVQFLKEPERYRRLGAQIPKGVLLVGPPGTGKTLLARAIAGEASVPFFSISGSEFVEMFVGVGAARVRDLFEQAKTKAPCIIFIDELDAVGKSRSGAPAGFGRHDEQEQTLNQLLVEMDGFDPSKGVILLAATNRPEVLDPALMRAGRFDRRIVVDMPDVRGRTKILQVHLRKIRYAPGLNVERIAARTPGFSGADLANLVNEAALLAARHGKQQVEQAEFEEAADRLIAGVERRSRVLSDAEKDVVAHHEAGHAIVAALVPHADPVHKITIIPRTLGSLGFTMQLPLEDRVLQSKPELEDRLAILLGGRAAEELCFGQITTGAHNDIERATQIARHMVWEAGMSDRIGPISFTTSNAGSHLPGADPFGRGLPISEATAEVIDDEIAAFVRRAHDRARELIRAHREGIERLATLLRQHETLEGDALKRALEDAVGTPVTLAAPAETTTAADSPTTPTAAPEKPAAASTVPRRR
jgi:cell division protease FtsH